MSSALESFDMRAVPAWPYASDDSADDGATVPMTGTTSVFPQTPLDTSEPRYITTGTLGAGGMGEVDLCVDRRMGREIARKVMRREAMTQPELRARFIREALLQGQLEHPSIVPVYDVSVDETGAAHFTMKRVRGTTLGSVLELARRGASPLYFKHKLLTAFANVCLAVDFAHSRGVVHRDLKPENVMLGHFGEVYVLDWGIAKVEHLPDVEPTSTPLPSSAAATTELGAVLGTPGYMAPEQIMGDPQAIDARADVYALGAILFEILTLARFNEGQTTRELASATLRGSHARPSSRSPSYDVPPELEAIIVKATALEKKDRFASARELHDALARFLEGDRDLQRRRELSRRHARQGVEAATRDLGAGASDAEARAEAMRELGRALVLDPENTAAADQLVELLTREPRGLPPEVARQISVENQALLRVRAFWAIVGYALWFAVLPVLALSGVRSYAALGFATLAWAAVILGYLFVHRRPAADGTTPLFVQILVVIAIGGMSALVGPFLIVPTLAVCAVYGLALGARARGRWFPAVGGCLAVAVPCFLEWAGVVPPSYVHADGGVLLLPRAVELGRAVMPCFVFASSLIPVVMVTLLAKGFRDVLTRSQRRVHLYAWQLRQLLPESRK